MFRKKSSIKPPDDSQDNLEEQEFDLGKVSLEQESLMKTLWAQNPFRKKPQINLQEEQTQKLQEIGEQFRQIRTNQGLSLEKIGKKTRISLRLLKAIEAGNLEILPEPIYIRGFLKQFAEALGLDGSEIASSFPLNASLKQGQYPFGFKFPSLQLRPFHLYVLYILLVILSVRGLSNLLKQSALDVRTVENSPQPSLKASPVKSSSPKPAKPVSTAKKIPDKAIIVDIQLKDESWLKVIADGKTEFEGILPKGTSRTWKANQQLTIRTGNAGGVLVTYNEQQPKQLGKPGQVEEVTYQANSKS